MSATHTPGPWKAYEATEECPLPAGAFVAVGTEEGGGSRTSIVCSMKAQGNGKYEPEVTAANARLIAAAPQMLDVLESCRNLLVGALDFDRDSRMVLVLDRTIAAAKGEEVAIAVEVLDDFGEEVVGPCGLCQGKEHDDDDCPHGDSQ